MFGRSTNLDASQAPPLEPDDVPEGYDRAAFAAGCFWGVEEFFLAVPGVVDAVSGYEGGDVDRPTYEQVCSGGTGHAEAVLVTFDPTRVSFDTLLEEFWRHHDPTTLNRQGPDHGTQYRSAVFVRNDAQAEAARASLDAFQARFKRPIVTEVAPASTFWPAEAYHQRYTERTGRGAATWRTGRSTRPCPSPVRVGAARVGTLTGSVPLLHHHPHLLREGRAPRGARLHDGQRRRPGPVAPAGGRRRLLPHRHRRARPEGGPGRRGAGDRPRRRGPTSCRPGSPRRGPASTSPTTTSSAPPSPATPPPSSEFLGRIHDNGYIYKDTYRGLYCVPCERYYARGRAAAAAASAPTTGPRWRSSRRRTTSSG